VRVLVQKQLVRVYTRFHPVLAGPACRHLVSLTINIALLPTVLVPTGGSPADHLLSPGNPVHKPLEVLYLRADQEYDGDSFLTYPRRRGWTTDNVRPRKLRENTE
jgi:hypothetical protein